MKVSYLIEQLQKLDMPDAEVRLNDVHGSEAVFVLASMKSKADNAIWIESKKDIDMAEEIEFCFQYANATGMDELDFFMKLLKIGFTLEDIKKYVPERYEYAHKFMTEHGLA